MKSIIFNLILYFNFIKSILSEYEPIQIQLTIETKFQLYAYFLRYYGFSNYYDINLQNEHSYTDRISPKKLEILSTDYIIVNNTKYTLNLLYEVIEIESKKLSMFWYNIPQPLVGNINYTGMSFALQPKNESFSIIHILKSNNQIDKMIIALEIKSRNAGVMHIGRIPESFKKMPYKGEFKVKYENWGCDVNSIYFTDKKNANITNKYIVNQRNVLLQTAKSEIVVSKNFFTYIKDTLLKSYYDKGLCFDKVLTKIGYITIDCMTKAKIEENLPYYFNIEIGDYVYSIGIEELTYQYKTMNFDTFIRIGISTSLSEENDVWMIGAIFLKRFNTVFDYDNKKVKLYSQLPRIRKIRHNNQMIGNGIGIRFFIVTIVILMIGGIIMNIYIYKKII